FIPSPSQLLDVLLTAVAPQSHSVAHRLARRSIFARFDGSPQLVRHRFGESDGYLLGFSHRRGPSWPSIWGARARAQRSWRRAPSVEQEVEQEPLGRSRRRG